MTATYAPARPIWCAGCGHFGVQGAMAHAFAALQIPPHEIVVLAGIGCSGTVQNNLGTYGYHALHGRVLPTAAGVHLANPHLTVIAAGGDGDGYAIGMGHLVHAFRRDLPFVYVVMNNGVYGLTKGQDSPTRHGLSGIGGFDAIDLGLSIPATGFLARGFSRHPVQLQRLMTDAIRYAREAKGFAFIEVLSPCVTYNDTYASWEQAVVDVAHVDDHDPTDRAAAFAVTTGLAAEGKIATGQILLDPDREPRREPVPAAEDLRPAVHASAYAEILDRYRV